MGFQAKGLTPEKINAPQAILHVANEGQPRGSVGAVRLIGGSEDPSHDIFIERDGKGLGDLLGNQGVHTAASEEFVGEAHQVSENHEIILHTRRE